MNYILNEPWCLRGWKNKPYCLCNFTSPAPPVEISEKDKDVLSGPFAYSGGEPLVRRDFIQIVDAILQRGLFVAQIFTNGSLVS